MGSLSKLSHVKVTSSCFIPSVKYYIFQVEGKLVVNGHILFVLLLTLQETSADMHQKLLKFQEEVAKEREILKTELKEAMDELDKLHTKEAKVEKVLKHLEQVNESQNEELSQLETKLQRFVEKQAPIEIICVN